MFITTGLYFLYEKQRKAFLKSLLPALLFPLLFILPYIIRFEGSEIYSVILLSILFLLVLLLLLPFKQGRILKASAEGKKYDERDIMFSRNNLQSGTTEYEGYYSAHPERKEQDDASRNKPGLLAHNAAYAHELVFPATDAVFDISDHLKAKVSGLVNEKNISYDPEKLAVFIKSWLLQLGATSAGITELKDHHLYSHRGRSFCYGEEVKTNHVTAIAFTVEMDRELMNTSPRSPSLLESANQYVRSAVFAVQLAGFVRNLGYDARAHIDGDYELVCPIVAEDAGLGTIGRLGLLITPSNGPRVRIGVITTALKLPADKPAFDPSVIDFCRNCMKCAEVCPAQAISKKPQYAREGEFMWKINSEACFDYWCKTGTDCGRCVAVCPYSHPDNHLHRLIRKGIRNNIVFSRLAFYMDGHFYGKKPVPSDFPLWIPK